MLAGWLGQFLSNMLRRLFVLSLVLCGGLSGNCAGVTADRTQLRQKPSPTSNCTDGSSSRTAYDPAERIGSSSVNGNVAQRRNSKQFEFGFADTENDATEVVGRRKKGKGYGRKILLLLGAMKAALFYAIAHAIAIIAGKALIAAKVALVISTTILLKKAFANHDKTSYEIIKHPHHSYVQTHSTAVDYDHKDDWNSEGRKISLRRKRFLSNYKRHNTEK